MNFLLWNIERKRGTRIGSLQSAIEELQGKVAKLENKVGVKARTAEVEEASQSEIEKILSQGHEAKSDDMWSIP